MPRRTVLGLLAAVVFAALAVRLGVWQLHRLAQRRALNARIAERLAAPPVPTAALPRDTAQAHYRRAVVEGVADYAGEFVLAGRTHDGSPAAEGRAAADTRPFASSPTSNG